jgi:DNA-binding response OmpR family regulator
MKVAVVDDDPPQVELISRAISALGHECVGFERGELLLRRLRRDTFDALVLDWHLPDVTGPEIVSWVRGHLDHRIPILFVTNRNEESDLVEALACGADDYLVKPVRTGELKARLSALLRRSYPAQGLDIEVFGRYVFDVRRRSVSVDGRPVDLKQKEYELAYVLFTNAGRLLSRKHLLERVWGADAEVLSRSLDTHVSNLRTKLDLRAAAGCRLSAVYGLGYRIEITDPLSAETDGD